MSTKCRSIGAHSFALGDIGEAPRCAYCGVDVDEALREDSVTYGHRDRALDQLRTKEQIDKLTAQLGQVTQQRDDAAAQLMVKEQEAAFYKSELGLLKAQRQPKPFIEPSGLWAVAVSWVAGFSAAAGGITVYALAKFMEVL